MISYSDLKIIKTLDLKSLCSNSNDCAFSNIVSVSFFPANGSAFSVSLYTL